MNPETGREDQEEEIIQSVDIKSNSIELSGTLEAQVENKYKVMAPEVVDSYKQWAEERARDWHEINPDIVLLTETSAVPFGWLLRETLRAAFPAEKLPKFYRIYIGTSYSHPVIMNFMENKDGTAVDYLNARDIKPDSTVLVFDEINRGPKSGTICCKKDGKKVIDNWGQFFNGTLDSVVGVLEKHGINNIYADAGGPKNNRQGTSNYEENQVMNKESDFIKPTRTVKHGREPLNKKPEEKLGIKYVGFIEDDPRLKQRAQNYIHDLKLAGKEAGKELRVELEKNK